AGFENREAVVTHVGAIHGKPGKALPPASTAYRRAAETQRKRRENDGNAGTGSDRRITVFLSVVSATQRLCGKGNLDSFASDFERSNTLAPAKSSVELGRCIREESSRPPFEGATARPQWCNKIRRIGR